MVHADIVIPCFNVCLIMALAAPAIKVMGNDIHGREVHEAKTKPNKASYTDVHHQDVLLRRARFDV